MKEEKYKDSDGQELTKTSWSDGDVLYENKKGDEHRLDGPAVVEFGDEFWYKNGKLHREDGPAIIYDNGEEEYWLNGEEVSKREIDLIWLKKQVEQ